jgi:hypothetical protein
VQRIGRGLGWAVAIAALLAPGPLAGQWLTGETALETRLFGAEPLHFGQERHDASLAIAPEFYFRLGRGGVVVEPYARLDVSDGQRSHVDIRALAWEGAVGNWEMTLGISRVFWGVTESQHLVDIVNQTDLVENPDGEDKLGQPMIKVGRVTDVGVFEAFVLPGFRERTFGSQDGRLRGSVPVDVDRPIYESDDNERHVDFAARWSHFVGAFDLGVSWFHGTNREPQMFASVGADGFSVVPIYNIADQVGLDLQWTREAWLWKFEGITRSTATLDRFWAMTAGFEYTLYQILGSDADLGLITEVLLDDRGEGATTPFEDDVFVGGRLAMNDVAGSQVLFGGIVDRTSGSAFVNLEGSRRLSNYWTIDVQARAFVGVEAGELFYDLRDDDHLMISLRRFF